MTTLKALVVGGTWDENGGRASKVVTSLAGNLEAEVCNGGDYTKLSHEIGGYSLVVWMPKIWNDESKWYPEKDTGTVLICSKVMRPGYITVDAVKRIYDMHANAVIQIWIGTGNEKHTFALVDALGNEWVKTSDIGYLAQRIVDLYKWTSGAIRVPSVRLDRRTSDLKRFMRLNLEVADRVQGYVGKRYFGNVSTRCQSMFPGARMGAHVLVSPRNTDKSLLSAEDMVPVEGELHHPDGAPDVSVVRYGGARKPSVDAPVQVRLFELFPDINFFIHGHAYLKGAPVTEQYFPCGDMREVFEIRELIESKKTPRTCGAINLKNHGFLLYSQTVEACPSWYGGLWWMG